MKKLLSTLLLLAALLPGQANITITNDLRNIAGAPLNATVTLTPLSTPVSTGGLVYSGPPIAYTPIRGIVTMTNIAPGNYSVSVGTKAFAITVAADATGTNNLSQLATGTILNYAVTNTAGLAVGVSGSGITAVTNGTLVTLSVSGASSNTISIAAGGGIVVQTNSATLNTIKLDTNAVIAFGATNWEAVLNVKAFGAVGDGATDDTAAIQAAITAGASGTPRIYIPAGRYLLTSALSIPEVERLEIYGDGATGYDPDLSATILWQTNATDADGIQAIVAGASGTWKGVHIHDLAIIGKTNWGWNVTNCGIRFEHTSGTERAPFQACRIENVVVSGWANGVKIRDATGTVLEQVRSMYNTNRSYWFQAADTTDLRSCWGGWGEARMTASANDRTTAIWNEPSGLDVLPGRSGLGINIRGGEWGNCFRIMYGDSLQAVTWIGGNYESVYGTEAILLTNNCYFVHVSPRWGYGSGESAIPMYRVTAGQASTRTSGIKIVGGATDFTAPWVSVEGTTAAGEMPLLNMLNSPTTGTMVYRTSIGGAVTRTYYGNSAPDIHYAQTWTGKQTMSGISDSALRILNGNLYAGLEVGGDSGATTATANANKFWSVAGASYADETADSIWNNALMHYASYQTSNTFRIGGNPNMAKGMTHLRFETAATVSDAPATRWSIDPSGDLIGNWGSYLYADGRGLTNVPSSALSDTNLSYATLPIANVVTPGAIVTNGNSWELTLSNNVTVYGTLSVQGSGTGLTTLSNVLVEGWAEVTGNQTNNGHLYPAGGLGVPGVFTYGTNLIVNTLKLEPVKTTTSSANKVAVVADSDGTVMVTDGTQPAEFYGTLGVDALIVTNDATVGGYGVATTNWVIEQIATLGAYQYFTGTTNALTFTNSTESVSRTNIWQTWLTAPTTVNTQTFGGLTANAYIRHLVSTNTYTTIEAGPASVQSYVFKTGGAGTVSGHYEFYLLDTVSNICYEIASSAATTISATPGFVTWSVMVPSSYTWTNPVKFVVAFKMDSVGTGGPTLSFVNGGIYDGHMTFTRPLSGATINMSQVVGSIATNNVGGAPTTAYVPTVQANGAVVWTNQPPRTLSFTIDGGGSTISTGVKGFLEVPYAGTITKVTMLADQSGSCVVDVWKDTYANYPPTNDDSITASAVPTITTATKSQDSTLTGWTKTVAAGDIIGFNVDSASTITRLNMYITIQP